MKYQRIPDIQSAAGSTPGRLALPVVFLLISLVIPFVFTVGPLRLSVYRLVLIFFFFPCVILWLRGRAGPVRLADLSLLFFCAWAALSFAVVHGVGKSIEGGGILFLETMGAYLIARCFVRDAESFRRMVRLLFIIIAAMLPFAVWESVTGQNIMREIFDKIYPAYHDVFKLPRWGLRRVQGPFEHPILFGVFCSGILALVHVVLGYQTSWIRRVSQTLAVATTAFLSLSSGPLISMGVQIALLGWDDALKAIKSRWKIFAGLALFTVLLVNLFSNRSIPRLLISFFAFNTKSAWNRLRIWEYGSASVLNHPLWGIGLNEWERPQFMVKSVDMLWLVPAMRHGLPGGLALHLAFFAVFLPVLVKKGLDAQQKRFRTGFLISMAGFYISGWTVYFWNATYVLFIFLLGSGVWLLEAKPTSGAHRDVRPGSPVGQMPRGSLYRRNAIKNRRRDAQSPSGTGRASAASPEIHPGVDAPAAEETQTGAHDQTREKEPASAKSRAGSKMRTKRKPRAGAARLRGRINQARPGRRS